MKTKMGRGVPRVPSRDKELQEHQFILDVIIDGPGPPRGLRRRRRGGGTGRVEATMRWAYKEGSMCRRGGFGRPGDRAAGGNSSSARGAPPICMIMNSFQTRRAVEPQKVLGDLYAWNTFGEFSVIAEPQAVSEESQNLG